MRVLRYVIAISIAVVCGTGVISALQSARAATNGAAGFIALAHAALAAESANDAAKLRMLYATNAVVIDDAPPYVWQGVDASARWAGDVHKMAAAPFQYTLGKPVATDIEAARAYFTFPIDVTAMTPDGKQSFRDTGLWTVVFVRSGAS